MDVNDLLSDTDKQFVVDTAKSMGLDDKIVLVVGRLCMTEGKRRVANSACAVLDRMASRQMRVSDVGYALQEARLKDLQAQVAHIALVAEVERDAKEIDEMLRLGIFPALLARLKALGHYKDLA